MHFRPWDLVFLAGFIIYLAIRHVYERRASGVHRIAGHRDVPVIVLVAVLLGALVLPLLHLFTPVLRFADYPLPSLARWCGAIIMLPALWLFWRSHADLRENWSMRLELRKGHQLVDHGVYRHVRHPMYAAIFLWNIAQGLLLANWLAGWMALSTFAILYALRVGREEQMLREHFGRGYQDYMGRTGRIFPKLRAGKRKP